MHKVVITRYKNLIVAIEYSSSMKPVRIFPSKESKVTLGSIYVGRVSNIKPELNAAFVDFTPELTGYLPLEECDYKLKIGDILPVRVVKEPVKSKLYSLSPMIQIVGEYCVVSPSFDTVTFEISLLQEKMKIKNWQLDIVNTQSDNSEIQQKNRVSRLSRFCPCKWMLF